MKIMTFVTFLSMAFCTSSFSQGDARSPVDFQTLLDAADAVVLGSLKLLDSERLSDDKNSFIHEDRYVINVEESIKGKVSSGALLILPTHKLTEPNPGITAGATYILFLRNSSAPLTLLENSKTQYSLAGGWRGLVPTSPNGGDNRLVGIVYKKYDVNLIEDKDAFLEVIRAVAQQKPLGSLSERGKKTASALGFK